MTAGDDVHDGGDNPDRRVDDDLEEGRKKTRARALFEKGFGKQKSPAL